MNRPSPARRWMSSLGRAVSWHRRKLAVVAVIAAVLSGLGALAPPAPATVPALRTTSTLAAGTVLTTDDVRVEQVPPGLRPDGALAASAEAVGQVLARGTSDGQMITSGDLASTRSRLSTGRVVAPLRLEDDQVADLLSEGMLVDVLAADERSPTAKVIAERVRVVAVPPVDRDAVRGSDGRLILIEVTPAVAATLARAAVVSRLSVVWR